MTNKTRSEPDHIIDAIGLLCPMPILKLGKLASTVAKGQILELWATDPIAPIDCEHFCNQKDFEFLGYEEVEKYDRTVFSIKIKT